MGHEVDRILDQLERSFRSESWHGPSVKEALDGVDAATAASRPLQGAHTIWELVLHVTYWKDIVRRRLAGERPETEEALNFPSVTDASPGAWESARADLESVHKSLREEIARLEDDELNEPAPGGSLSRYVMVHGIVQHDLYHAGQISILRKPQPKARQRRPAQRVKKSATSSRVPAKRASAAKRGRKATRRKASRRR